jgi:hypothetical protein
MRGSVGEDRLVRRSDRLMRGPVGEDRLMSSAVESLTTEGVTG